MASKKRPVVYYSFEGGEAAPKYETRADTELWIRTAKRLTNVRCTNGGGAKRRPGLARVASLSSTARLFPHVVTDGTRCLLAFRDGALTVFRADETIEATVTSCPWTSASVGTLSATGEGDRVIVASRSFAPQVLERTTAGSWSRSAFQYDISALGSREPFYRFPGTRGISLTPSATSGSGVTLTASAALFAASHVGARFRLHKRQCTVTAFSSATSVTVTIDQPLYPTLDITVGSSAGFDVGDACTTSADEIDCEVVQIVSGTVVRVMLTDGFTAPITTSNNLVGPRAKSAISGVAGATPAGTLQWDESMFSAARGYPGGCIFHRSRLWFFDHPLAPHVLVGSEQDLFNSFDVGVGDDADAIIAGIGDAIGRRVRHAVSAEQLIVLTEAGGYYVGAGPNSPLTPTTIDYLAISPEPAGLANGVLAAEGVIYADAEADRLLLLAPTGNVRRSWEAGEISDVAAHLVNSPVRLTMINGVDWGEERYLIAVNADGTLAVMHYRRAGESAAWTPWTTDGLFVDVAAFNGKCYAVVNRGGAFTLERFDDDRLLDESVVLSYTADPLTAAHLASKSWSLVWRKLVSGEARRVFVGALAANGSGQITTGFGAEAREVEVGRDFPFVVELWEPIDVENGLNAPTRISEIAVNTYKSGAFTFNGRHVTPYRVADDPEEPPPLRTGHRAWRVLGRRKGLTAIVGQSEPAPLEIRMIRLEVS